MNAKRRVWLGREDAFLGLATATTAIIGLAFLPSWREPLLLTAALASAFTMLSARKRLEVVDGRLYVQHFLQRRVLTTEELSTLTLQTRTSRHFSENTPRLNPLSRVIVLASVAGEPIEIASARTFYPATLVASVTSLIAAISPAGSLTTVSNRGLANP